jgi:glucose dehydrogenase
MPFNTKTLLLVAASLSLAAGAARADEWGSYGRDPGGTRFSPLTQITPANVAGLKPAWTFHTGDIADGKHGGPRSGFEATPLLVDGRLYVTTPFNRIVALDPASGKQLWAYDPKIDTRLPVGDGLISRGLAASRPGAIPRRKAPASSGCTRPPWMRGWCRWTPPPASPVPASARRARSACAASPAISPASTT